MIKKLIRRFCCRILILEGADVNCGVEMNYEFTEYDGNEYQIYQHAGLLKESGVWLRTTHVESRSLSMWRKRIHDWDIARMTKKEKNCKGHLNFRNTFLHGPKIKINNKKKTLRRVH